MIPSEAHRPDPEVPSIALLEVPEGAVLVIVPSQHCGGPRASPSTLILERIKLQAAPALLFGAIALVV